MPAKNNKDHRIRYPAFEAYKPCSYCKPYADAERGFTDLSDIHYCSGCGGTLDTEIGFQKEACSGCGQRTPLLKKFCPVSPLRRFFALFLGTYHVEYEDRFFGKYVNPR